MIRAALDRPAVIRYLGLSGAVLLAVDAYLFGAFPVNRVHVTVQSVATGHHGALILVVWAVGVTAMTAAWWYGRHLVGRGLVTVTWTLVTAGLWMVPFLVAPPTGSRDVYAYSCQGALYAGGLSPYRVGVSALPCPWLDSVSFIWRDTPAPYGPVFLMLAGVASKLGSLVAAVVAFRTMSVVGVVVIAISLVVLARRVELPADRAVWLVLACPLVPWHLIGGAHNDALTVGLLLAGLAVLAGARGPHGETRGTGPRRATGGIGALIVGGVLVGLSIAVKTTVGVALPFAALFAAGGPPLPAVPVLVRRAGTVLVAALGTLLAFSFGSGLGVGWIGALSHAGDSISWTSPPSAVGLAANYLGRAAGLHYDAIPAARAVALGLLPVALAAILWHSRDRDPLYGAGLAMLATIFLAPITQPWYLVWPLATFAVTAMSARWFIGTAVVAAFTVLPDGTGLNKITQVPASFAMTVLVVVVAVRSLGWVRGAEPREIDLDAERDEIVRTA